MAELKRTFSKAKMNKDLDERLVPPGEYRDANNIEIATSEGSNVGTAQSVYGNIECTQTTTVNPDFSHHTGLTSATVGSPAFCVGAIADEKNNKIYSLISDGLWFVEGSSYDDNHYVAVSSDYILEYDLVGSTPDVPNFKFVFNDIYHVQIPTSQQCVAGNEIIVANNTGVRAGMFAIFDDDAGNPHRIKVKHIFDANTGSSTYSTTQVFLEENFSNAVSQYEPIRFESERRVLNFDHETTRRRITGINIVDDLLMWTDNNSEPKRLNITRSIAGTGGLLHLPADLEQPQQDLQNGINRTFHTRLYAELDPSKGIECVTNAAATQPVWVEEEHITTIKKAPTTPPTLEMSSTQAVRKNTITNTENQTWSSQNSLSMSTDEDGDGTFELISTGEYITVSLNQNVDWRDGDIILATSEEISVGTESYFSEHEVRFQVDGNAPVASPQGAVTDPNNLQTSFDLRCLSVAPSTDIDSKTWYFSLERENPLFEFKFVRFGYRYRYTDGEYSPFSPWSEIAFLPGPYSYMPNKGYNLAMTNQLRNLKIKDYLVDTDYRPRDIVAVDILYKEEHSPNIYTVRTLNREDGVLEDGKLLWPDLSDPDFVNKRGELELTNEMIHAAVPENQLLRSWDNVPRKALAQDVVGNRIVYANYLQNYNLVHGAKEIKPKFTIGFEHTELSYTADWSNFEQFLSQLPFFNNTLIDIPTSSWLSEPAKSIKTLRTYHLGVVYSDMYGRETPVLTDKEHGSIYLDKDFCNTKNQLYVQMESEPPGWATHYKYYIKETSSEYYNLVLDRWYDAEDGNVWLSFPSSERNKVDIDTFLILKKQHGTDTAVKGKGRYKILAIENEAPDYVKTNQLLLGSIASSNFTSTGYPLVNSIYVEVEAAGLHAGYGVNPATEQSDLVEMAANNELWFRVFSTTNTSDWYNVVKISLIQVDSADPTQDIYSIKLDCRLGDDVTFTSTDNSYLTAVGHSMEFKKETIENLPEFDGRFFVKIYRDKLLEDNVLMGLDSTEYTVKSRKHIYHSKNYIDFTGQWDEGGNDPDKHVYWYDPDNGNTDDPHYGTGELGTGFTFNRQNKAGDGGYIVTPYTPLQEWEHLTSAVDNTNNNVGLKDYFESTAKFKWAIDNENAHYGGAGRGIHADHQGNRGLSGAAADWNEGWPGAGNNNTNDSQRIFMSDDYAQYNKASTSGGYASDVGRSSSHYGSVDPEAPPSDIYWGKEGDENEVCNVMHLSKFGISTGWNGEGKEWKHVRDYEGAQNSIAVEGNLNEQDDWDFASAIRNHGTLFRWAEDPDKTVYEVISAQVQTGIRNWEGKSALKQNKRNYFKEANLRVRYTIKFRIHGDTDGSYMGSQGGYKFNPIVNAIGANGQPVTGAVGGSVTQNTYTGLDSSNGAQFAKRPYNYAGLDHSFGNALTLQILEPYKPEEACDNKSNPNPAVFETEPKEDLGLDIYYEISPSYPITVEEKSNEMLLPIGSYFVLSATDYAGEDKPADTSDTTYTITSWTDNQTFAVDTSLLLAVEDNKVLNVHTTYGGIVQVVVNGQASGTSITIHGAPLGSFQPHNQKMWLSFWNCITFGNGVESDRIRDSFNLPTVQNGVKASTTLAEQYREERRKNGLIYSGIYNSTSGVNDLNQFIAGEKITKDVNPSYGSIQKIHTRNTDLLTLCEDKVLKIIANKDALYNADGNPELIATNRVLGTAVPLPGEFGISTEPGSFASYADNCYFTDASRGSVMKITGDSIAPISQVGMVDYFADTLKDTDLWTCIGSYDEKKADYNLTIEKRVNWAGSVLYGKQVYTTITWGERAKGWTSFKTFHPEEGLSINNNYYTWKNGSMWRHHSGDVGRNTFYGVFANPHVSENGAQEWYDNSHITLLFNDAPETVKSFNTINYEGSQAKRDQFTTSTVGGVEYNDGEYYNLTAATGWYCESITTNLQEGEVLEFKDKEGKWYNAIHGVTTSLSNLDETEFSVQGLGTATAVSHDGETITASDPVIPDVVLTVKDDDTDDLELAIVTEDIQGLVDQPIVETVVAATGLHAQLGVKTMYIKLDEGYVSTYDNLYINDTPGTIDTTAGTHTFTNPHANISSLVLTQYNIDIIRASITFNSNISVDTTIAIDFDWRIPPTLKDIPVDVDVYYRTTGGNISKRSATSYDKQTITVADLDDVVEGFEQEHGNYKYVNFTSNVPFATKTTHVDGRKGAIKRLHVGVERQIFELTFTVTDGTTSYYYRPNRENSFFNIEHCWGKPLKLIKNNIEQEEVLKRWRFIETILTKDSSNRVKSVKIQGYYTTPDYRVGDMLLKDGSLITADDVKKQNRGIIINPMLEKTQGTIAEKITQVKIGGRKENDGETELHVLSLGDKRLPITIKGTAGATAKLNVFELDGLAGYVVQDDITIGSNGYYRTDVELERATAAEEYNIWLEKIGSADLESSVPQITSKASVFKFANITLKLDLTQTASLYTIPSVKTILTAPAFTSMATMSSSIVEVDAKTDYHKTLTDKEQKGERLYSFTVTVASADGSKTSIAAPGFAVPGTSTDAGFIANIPLENVDSATNGGTVARVRDLYLRESGADVVFYGYVAVQELGKSDVTIEIPVDNLLNTA